MNAETIDHAFILAAGLGTRLRPYTDTMPKPLVEICRQSLLGRSLDQLAEAGVKHCTINTHYMADQIEALTHARTDARTAPKITLSHEDVLLDTGGGIKKCLGACGSKPFIVINGDSFCEENPLPALMEAWNPETMDILLLLQPVSTMKLTQGIGDYTLDAQGKATRSLDKSGTHMFTSIRINHPRIFDDAPDGAFSYRDLMDKTEAKGRLYGLEHTGNWHHISTPEDLERVNTHMATTIETGEETQNHG